MPPTPRKRKEPPSPPRRPPSRLDFRAPADGAWYGARVAVQRGALRVMYEEFPEEQDDWYDPACLASERDVAALRARFRALSPPLDDARCRDLRAGAPLCVSCALDGGELKFYDAVLESVSPAAHETVDGEERCPCRFAVWWTEGPRTGSREEIGVERVCCVQSSSVQDPVLTEFFDGVTKLLGNDNGKRTASQATGTVAEEGGAPRDAPPGFRRKYGARK
ncbi:uncharacterized protein LOC133883961 [Phragmites australis]|uniref:uncharacterized protein LOC133883961 n=1 Tax=Phragmites australis TaxID=29695 RepID=UPI002D79A3E4|nr:uncharacterized protein LOC133883961 [Phragmites australis]